MSKLRVAVINLMLLLLECLWIEAVVTINSVACGPPSSQCVILVCTLGRKKESSQNETQEAYRQSVSLCFFKIICSTSNCELVLSQKHKLC